MIKLNRSKDNKWIMQKNISSSDLFEVFVEAMNNQNNIIDNEYLLTQFKRKFSYRGRSNEGSSNTMGVRLSQACFYMLGYKKGKNFYPSPMTDMYLNNKNYSKEKLFLVNLYSMQFPSPYSDTPNNFKIYIGRLIIKLLLDKRIDNRLYIDECIYFLPFMETINFELYEELISSILEYRKLSYDEKLKLFKNIDMYDDLFANCAHEMNYYFIRIFSGFGVFNIVEDKNHNRGRIFSFKHGKGSTYRTDAYASRKKYSGYIELNSLIVKNAHDLASKYSAFDMPELQSNCLSREEWIRDLYEFKPLKFISVVFPAESKDSNVIDIVKNMVYQSRYGSRDGKTFENSLKPIFELFRENRNVEIISGSGDTDLLCVMTELNSDEKYKINVDAKTSHHATEQINPIRITNHIKKNNSRYCIIVSPKFSRGVKTDISGFNIVTIEAETLANYCLKECINSSDGLANYSNLDIYIKNALGTDITRAVNNYLENNYNII